jgi:GGDEF domain-containing protein
VCAHRLPWDGTLLSVGVSIGLVELHPSLPDSAAVMRAADVACYAAKRAGRGRVHTHVPVTASGARGMPEIA